ncbi:MAG TPA: amino acid permease [Clostridia bacterium]|nr:amino acid permease [Clostridia bacterium]
MTSPDNATSSNRGLRRGLKARHLAMISIGGVIGVGMFLGSGATVRLGGPGVVFSYLLGGVIMMLVMVALGEMSVAYPVAGSFRTYAAEFLHPYFGFTVGWIYWLSWLVVMSAEIVAATTYMSFWFPRGMTWIFGLLFALAMTVVNVRSVESFGEFEFWFSLIKVMAILAFIAVGAMAILGIVIKPALGLSNYTGYGGFFPNGLRGVFLAMVMVMVAYGGTEVIGVAAAETRDPEKNVPKAINGIVARTLILYVGSMTILVGTIPWMRVGLGGSPFVKVFTLLGIPAAPHIMNLVVISAALSSMNSGLYTSSRMLYSLAEVGFAPRALAVTNPKTKVPARCVLISTASLYLGVLAYHLSPAGAFLYITGIAAFGFLFSWLVISLSHIYFRRSFVKTHGVKALKYKMPGYPYTSWFALGAMVVIIATLWFIPQQRAGLLSGLVLLAGVSAYWLFLTREHTLAGGRVPAPLAWLERAGRPGPVLGQNMLLRREGSRETLETPGDLPPVAFSALGLASFYGLEDELEDRSTGF